MQSRFRYIHITVMLVYKRISPQVEIVAQTHTNEDPQPYSHTAIYCNSQPQCAYIYASLLLPRVESQFKLNELLASEQSNNIIKYVRRSNIESTLHVSKNFVVVDVQEMLNGFSLWAV